MSGNIDAIVLLLESLNLTEITYNKARHEIRCARDIGRNPSSVKIDTNTLYYNCFSTGRRGSIYTLIMERLHKSFPQALYWAAEILDIDKESLNTEIVLPFKGYYKNIIKERDEPELSIPTYDEAELNNFVNKGSVMFAKDGIGFPSQHRFRIGYDMESMRITIPQWNINGELIGVMGRMNNHECPTEQRWHPIISCPRSLTLYGYHINYDAIQQRRLCVLLESEKSVMQLDTMGLNIGVATCTNNISNTQAKYAKALMVENLVVAFDEGVEEEVLVESARKLKIHNPLLKNRVGYIYDGDNEILPKGSKASPTDLGIKVFTELLRQKIKWV